MSILFIFLRFLGFTAPTIDVCGYSMIFDWVGKRFAQFQARDSIENAWSCPNETVAEQLVERLRPDRTTTSKFSESVRSRAIVLYGVS
jgi:hypothetical protein